MSSYKRVQQWAAFARVWHIYDAKWQNPFDSAKMIAKYLRGLHKPLYHPMSDCGDQVVVINCKHIALPGEEWKKRVYFHHTGYPGGATWTMAWELHKRDPTMIMQKAVYASLGKNIQRRHLMQRLHLFDDENIPESILENISSQIKQLRIVPRKLSFYTEEEINKFPKLADYPMEHGQVLNQDQDSLYEGINYQGIPMQPFFRKLKKPARSQANLLWKQSPLNS